jgi:lipopolysaccharide transport system permease protein
MKSNPIRIHKPYDRHEAPYFKSWLLMITNAWRSRELVMELLKRDLFAEYKRSLMGNLWVVLAPLMSILVWIFFKQAGILMPGDTDIPYPVYILLTSSIWGLFMGFYTSSANTLTAGSNIVQAIAYPHEIFLFEKAIVQLFHFFVSFGMIFLILIPFGIYPSWHILFLPFVLLPLFLLGAGIGLVTGLFSVIVLDVQLVMSAVMGLWMLITPVIYSDKINHPHLLMIVQWNPLTYLVSSAREIAVHGRFYHAPQYFLCAFGSFLFFVISCRLFYVSENKITERIV